MTAKKNKLKRTSDGEGDLPAGLYRRLRVNRLVLTITRVVGSFFLLLLGCYLYLSIVGFPQFVEKRVIDYAAQRGYETQLAGLRLDLFQGIIAEDVIFYDPAEPGRVMVDAKRVALKFDPFERIQSARSLRGVRVFEAELRLQTDGRDVVFEQVGGRVTFNPDGARITGLYANLNGIAIAAEGFVAPYAGAEHGHKDSHAASPLQRPVSVNPKGPFWAALIDELSTIQFKATPRARIDFAVYPQQSEANEFSVEVDGFESRYRGLLFDQWHISLEAVGADVTINEVTLRRGDDAVTASCDLDLDEKVAKVLVNSTLPGAYWLNLVPLSWRTAIEDQGIVFHGPVKWGIETDRVPFERLASAFKGWAEADNLEYRDVPVNSTRCTFSRSEHAFHLAAERASMGQGAQRGDVVFELELDLTNNSYDAVIKMGCDPEIITPLLPPKPAALIHRFEFMGRNPSVSMTMSGRKGVPEAFVMDGQYDGGRCVYNGESVSRFSAHVAISNSVMTLAPLLIVRDEGQLEAAIRHDAPNMTYYLDRVESTMNPKSIARFLGPKMEKIFRPLRFEGPCSLELSGVFNYGTNLANDIRARVDGEAIGVTRFLSDRCAFDLTYKGTDIIVEHLKGDLYGGQILGRLGFHGIGKETNVSYDVSVQLANLNFRDVARTLRQADDKPYGGTVDAVCDISGRMGKGMGKTAMGDGHLSIRDGRLYQIPLLGGLSKLLGRVYPGAGFSSQTDFNANYIIHDSKVSSSNMVLTGNLLEVAGRGSYLFNEELDFVVSARPVEGGDVKAVLRAITLPVSKLLEFKLSGTLQKPEWRPHNLPKELFLIFD